MDPRPQQQRPPLLEPLLRCDSEQHRDTWIMTNMEQEITLDDLNDEIENLSDPDDDRNVAVAAATAAAHHAESIRVHQARQDETPWYRNPLQLTAMLSNFSTSYNVVNISLVLPILEQLQATTTTSASETSAVASSLLAGMMVGQVVGGALGDTSLGRLHALRLMMAIQLVASLASACVFVGKDLYMFLALWRLILGVGAGGVYPLAAVLSAEQQGMSKNDNLQDSLHRVVLTFSMQGVGFLAAPLLAVPLLYTVKNLALVWRLLLGAGCVPGLALLFLQWLTYRQSDLHSDHAVVPQHDQDAVEPRNWEPERDDDEDDSDQEDVGTFLDSSPNLVDDALFLNELGSNTVPFNTTDRLGFWAALRLEDNLPQKLLGTAGTWFLFDVLFYGNTLFEPIVIEAAFGARNHESARHLLQRTAMDSLVLTSIALPGYVVAGLLLGKTTCGIAQTPRFVMLQGFACMSVLYLAIGINWKALRHYPVVLVTLYGLTFFFANYGPNTTTFVLPSLVYSAECRSTLNGLSAAAGKLGALTGASLFAPAAEKIGAAAVLLICSGIAMAAFVSTKLFVRIREHNEPAVV